MVFRCSAEGFKGVFDGYWLHLVGFCLFLPPKRLGGFHLGESMAIKGLRGRGGSVWIGMVVVVSRLWSPRRWYKIYIG